MPHDTVSNAHHSKLIARAAALCAAFIIPACGGEPGGTAGDPPLVEGALASALVDTTVTIDNRAVWRDTSGGEVKAQGGGITKVGQVYHWFGAEFGGVGDFHFYAINHYASTDLKSWTKQAPALRPGMPGIPFGSGSWVGRPWVSWNPNDNRFVMALEWGGGGGFRNQYAFLTSASIDGPWTYQSSKLIRRLRDANNVEYNLGDLGVYTEGNSAWLLYTFDKPQPNYAQAIIKLAPDFMTPLAPTSGNYVEFSGGKWMAGVQEAAAVFKRNGAYYYFTSLCNGWKSSPTRYRTAPSMAGPWTTNAIVPTNPSSSDSFNTQHDFVLPIIGPTQTTYVYFGDRWSNFRTPTGAEDTGRYGWYPLSFDTSGVPTINAPSYAANGGDFQLRLGEPVAKNELENPGFENDLQSWTFTGNASVATAAAEVHTGTKAMKAWSRSPYTTTLHSASASSSSTASSYTAAVWSRAGGAFSRRVLEVYVNDVKTRELALPSTTSWTRYAITDVAVGPSERLKVAIALESPGGGWTQFDDFVLERQ